MTVVPERCVVCGTVPITAVVNDLAVFRCPKCALMWRQSFDIPLSHYEDMDAGFSAEKGVLQKRNIKDRIRVIKKYLSLDDTCDVGGSKGYFVEALMDAGYQRVWGIDPQQAAVERAQLQDIPMIVGSTADIGPMFAERGTKNATLFHVIEHLPDPVADIKRIYDALPVGGHLIIETPDFGSYAFKKTDYQHKLVYPEHLFYFNINNLQTFLKNMGFTVVAVRHRDFDQYHLNFREALFRLGLGEKKGSQVRGLSNTTSVVTQVKPQKKSFVRRIRGVVRELVEFLLSVVVKLTGRQNFMLVIVRK